MGTTRRPKLVRDMVTPWGTAYAGVWLTHTLGGWSLLCGRIDISDADVQSKPDWFAVVDVCDDCGKELCGSNLMGYPNGPLCKKDPAPELCHGHAPKLPYPMTIDEVGFVVHGDGKVDGPYSGYVTNYPFWRTREHAERFARAMKAVVGDLQADLNYEARRK